MQEDRSSLACYRRTMWSLSWPAMISGLSVPILGLIDTAIVGRIETPVALGAVALGSWLFDMLYWSFGFLRMGTTGLISQARGRQDLQGMRPLLMRPLLIGLFAGVLIVSFGALVAPKVIQLMVGDPTQVTLINKGVDYFTARMYGGPAVLMNYALLGWLLGMGQAKRALGMQLGLNVVNGCLSVWWGLSFGVIGVGWASAASQWLTLGYWGRDIWLKRCPPLPFETLKLALKDIEAWRTLISLNVNLWIRTCLLLGSFGLLNAIGARFGALTLSANALLFHLQSLQAFALDGFAHGTEIMIGEQLGAQNKEGYRKTLRVGFECTMVTSVMIAFIYFVGSEQILSLLTHHEAILNEANQYLAWAIVSPLFSAPCFLLDGVMIGAVASTAMRNSMLISVMTLILGVFLLIPIWGNHGLWCAFIIFMIMRFITLIPTTFRLGKSRGISHIG